MGIGPSGCLPLTHYSFLYHCMFCLLLVKYVTTLGRATQADPTARRVGPTRRSVRMMAVGDDRQLRVTGNTEGCQVGPSADCKDDGDVSDG